MADWEAIISKSKASDPAVKHFVRDTLRIAKEVNAPEELIASLEKGLDLSFKRNDFAENSSSETSAIASKIASDTWTHDWPKVHEEGKTTWNCKPGMISSGIMGEFLKSIVSMTSAKNILEVGMYTGFTCVSMAEALPADGKVVTIDIDEYLKTWVQSHIEESPHKDKVEIVIGQALDVMAKMVDEGKRFDIVFLDAVKDEYPAYIKLCIEGNLLAPNGTILVDNAFQGASGYTNPDSSAAKFAEVLKNYPTLHKVLVPISDGLFIVRRKSEVDQRDA